MGWRRSRESSWGWRWRNGSHATEEKKNITENERKTSSCGRKRRSGSAVMAWKKVHIGFMMNYGAWELEAHEKAGNAEVAHQLTTDGVAVAPVVDERGA